MTGDDDALSTLTDTWRLERLEPPSGPVDVVLDTDTYNEVDDQFAVTYALLSPEKIRLHALYAAPFFNDRSNGPADGMERSYQEILRLLEQLGMPGDGIAFRGSPRYLGSLTTRCPSRARTGASVARPGASGILSVRVRATRRPT